MKLRLFWIGVAAAAAVAIACGGGDDGGPSPEERLGGELARANNVAVLMQDQAPTGAWHPGHHGWLPIYIWGITGNYPAVGAIPADVLDGSGNIADINHPWLLGLRVFNDVRVIPHMHPDGTDNQEAIDAFQAFEYALRDAMHIAAAPEAQARHYNEVADRLRLAQTQLLALAEPAGPLDRMQLLATIRDAYGAWIDTEDSAYFTTGPAGIGLVPRVGGLPGAWNRPWNFRAASADMSRLITEANIAARVAFNETNFPLTQAALNERQRALQAGLDAFMYTQREHDTPLVLLHTPDVGYLPSLGTQQHVLSATIVPSMIHADDGFALPLMAGFRQITEMAQTRENTLAKIGAMQWRWSIAGAVPEGVEFMAVSDMPSEWDWDDDWGWEVDEDDARVAYSTVAPFTIEWIADNSAAGLQSEILGAIHFPPELWKGDDKLESQVTFSVTVALLGAEPETGARPTVITSNTYSITLVPAP